MYYWGQTILAELYRDLHMSAYQTQRTMAPGLTLLMVWSWEHIGVTRPITRAETRRPSEPFACRYRPPIQYTSTESVGFWRRCLDEIIMFDWTPYDGVEQWGTALAAGGEDDSEDQMYLRYTQIDCWLISRTAHIVMRYMPSRVRRQFEQVQDVVPDRFRYPVVSREYGTLWGHGTTLWLARSSWLAMHPMPWVHGQDMGDAGVTLAYA